MNAKETKRYARLMTAQKSLRRRKHASKNAMCTEFLDEAHDHLRNAKEWRPREGFSYCVADCLDDAAGLLDAVVEILAGLES